VNRSRHRPLKNEPPHPRTGKRRRAAPPGPRTPGERRTKFLLLPKKRPALLPPFPHNKISPGMPVACRWMKQPLPNYPSVEPGADSPAAGLRPAQGRAAWVWMIFYPCLPHPGAEMLSPYTIRTRPTWRGRRATRRPMGPVRAQEHGPAQGELHAGPWNPIALAQSLKHHNSPFESSRRAPCGGLRPGPSRLDGQVFRACVAVPRPPIPQKFAAHRLKSPCVRVSPLVRPKFPIIGLLCCHHFYPSWSRFSPPAHP